MSSGAVHGGTLLVNSARCLLPLRGAVRIGGVAALSDRQVAALTAAVRAVTPDPAARTVITTTAATVDLVDAVTAGLLDCAVVHPPALIGALQSGPIRKIPRSLLCPPITRRRGAAVAARAGRPGLRDRATQPRDGGVRPARGHAAQQGARPGVPARSG
ncbi:hypothetical protein [Saccharopolyspora sp. ASAGF58]|uniref:hypothetical protein n=1 Tax=Saccharopolyspora sp. ASAGF58 TaxID=2719023 RepID=UPI001FF0D461|nr:hypothetical protein [Saccharopolyspora sp. ASAGF58]